MESEWHGDVNTVQHWRGVWEPIGRQAWEPSRTTPGMDLGNYGDDFGMNIRRGVHAYALSGSTVNLFHSYTDLLSCYVGVDTALGQKRDSSVDDGQLDPRGVAFNLKVFVHVPCIARCSITVLSGRCHYIQTACDIDVWGCVVAEFGDLWEPGGKLRHANKQLEHEGGWKTNRFHRSFFAHAGLSW